MPQLKDIALAATLLLSFYQNTVFAQDSDNRTDDEPREFKSYGEYQEYVANKTATPAARSRHSMGLGFNYNGTGYRYTFLNERINPYFTVLIPPFIGAGLEFHSDKRPNQSVDVYLGHIGFFGYLGANWKWHASGYQNSGLELGLGLIHAPKQSTDNTWFGVDDGFTTITWSIGFKF